MQAVRRAAGGPAYAARGYPDADLYAGWNFRLRKSHDAAGDGGDRNEDPPQQYLPPAPASGRETGGGSRRAAQVYGLERADPDRQRRFPGVLPGRDQENPGRGRDLPEPPGRFQAVHRTGRKHGHPAGAWIGHRHGLRRMLPVPLRLGDGEEKHGNHPPLGRTVQKTPYPGGPDALRDRPGSVLQGPADRERQNAGGHGLHRLRHRRAERRRRSPGT